MFITFEGIDCCGKSTQARLLVERLAETGREVVQLREPGDTRLSEHIRGLVLDREFEEMNERTELLLFAASRAQLVGERIMPALEQGNVVVCDRFADSTVAYQGFGRGLPLDDIEHINRVATQDIVPDMTFFIDISPELALERCRSRFEGMTDRMEEGGIRFYERVINGYMTLASRDTGRFYVIDGSKSIADVQMTIWRLVLDRLPERGTLEMVSEPAFDAMPVLNGHAVGV